MAHSAQTLSGMGLPAPIPHWAFDAGLGLAVGWLAGPSAPLGAHLCLAASSAAAWRHPQMFPRRSGAGYWQPAGPS
eukprot:12919224-Prorocentrum_lima.AAC.1